MATIYSNRNDSVGSHTTVNPNSTSTWVGGVVPATTDQVYVVGRRTTVNMGQFTKWTGTMTITVASTTNFASSGFFYTHTDQSHIVKVNYTGTTSTTFTGCSVDETGVTYPWTNDGVTSYIPNGAYIHNPAYVITINEGETFECNEMIIQEGGWLYINGGTLKLNQGIQINDGRLIGRGNGTIIITRNTQSLNASYIGYMTANDYRMSIIDIDGGETRTYGTLVSNVNLGDSSISVSGVTNGTFAVGDEIAIYDEFDVRRRNNGYNGYRDVTHGFKNMDEGLDIVGVNGNTLYLALKNGVKGDIKTVTTSGSQKIIEVKPDTTYFNAGDKIIVDNKTYTINSIEDSEYTLYDYDFTNTETDLSDFWVNASDHVYSAGWQIYSGIGIGTGTTSYKELTHKYFWDREVIVEATISPMDNFTSGNRGTGKYTIQTTYDPSFRWGHRGDDVAKADYFQINDGSDYIHFYQRNMTQWASNRLSRDTSLRTQTRTAALYRVETRRGLTKTYVNGSEFSTDYRRDGNWKGTVGLQFSNNYARCSRMTIKAPTQKLYITTTDSFNVGSTVYRTGVEIPHTAGRKVVKIASINTGNGSHTDLAFAYRGQRGNGEWPLMIQVNGATAYNSSLPYIHNHDMNIDYYYNLGDTTSARSITIDLTLQKTFTHVSFVPRIQDYSTYYGFNGVAIYGSNDLSTWDTLYGPTNDTKKWYYGSYNRMGYYETGTVSYRYVKFETKGAQQGTYATNRYVNIGVHDFSDGYTLELNNTSDFNIGDTITILTDSGYSFGSREIEAYYSWVSNNASDPETFWHGGWLPQCTITNKIGNTIYLDKPIFWGYVEQADSITVVKLTRNFLITGTMGPSNSSSDWRWPNILLNAGSNYGKIYSFKNTRFDYIGSYRNGGSGNSNRGIIVRTYDYWWPVIFDGIVQMMSQDGTTEGGLQLYSGGGIVRNSVLIGSYTGVRHMYPASYFGGAIYNNKMHSVIYGIYNTNIKSFNYNYNEIACCNYGINVSTMRVDRNVAPFFNEIKRNFVKGTSEYGLSLTEETIGPRRLAFMKVEDNKFRAMDDYVLSSRTFSGWPITGLNAMGEHTGSRLSRYRNEGYVTQGDNSSDLSFQSFLKNFGRYGYDLAFTVYNVASRDYNSPGITRFYTINGDSLLSILGMELDVYEDIPLQIHVKFEYRFAWTNRLQDDGTDDGRLRCYSLQHGTITEMKYGEVPSTMNDGWYTFDGTFSAFASEAGRIAVYLNKAAYHGYVEIRNSSAEVLCDYPESIRVIGNTFILNRIWEQYGEIRDTKPLTGTNLRTTKINRMKF